MLSGCRIQKKNNGMLKNRQGCIEEAAQIRSWERLPGLQS